MFDGRRQTRRSPRRASHEDSENECEGRLSLGTGGECAPATKPAESARSPLTSANNGGEPPLPEAEAATAARQPSALTPSKVKPPMAPGVSRFGFNPATAGSLSPRRPGNDRRGVERANSQETNTIVRAAAASLLSPPRMGSSSSSGSNGRRGVVSKRSGGADVRATTASAAPAASDTISATTRSRSARGAGVGGSSTSAAQASGAVAGGRTRKPGTAPVASGRANTRATSGTAAQSSRRLSVSLSITINTTTVVRISVSRFFSFFNCTTVVVVLHYY